MSGFTFLTREQLFDRDDELDIMKKRGGDINGKNCKCIRTC